MRSNRKFMIGFIWGLIAALAMVAVAIHQKKIAILVSPFNQSPPRNISLAEPQTQETMVQKAKPVQSDENEGPILVKIDPPKPPAEKSEPELPKEETPAAKKATEASSPSRGPQDAKITIEEFTDFYCRFCKKAVPTLQKIMTTYPADVRWVFRHYPLSLDPERGSLKFHEASMCAQEQGKFWQFHDAVFALPGSPRPSDLDQIVSHIGLNTAQFQECMKAETYRHFVLKDQEEGRQRGVSGTPVFYINGHVVEGAYPYPAFKEIIESILRGGQVPESFQNPSTVPNNAPAPSKVKEASHLNPSQGPSGAPVTIVEFSDFHCPYCRTFGQTLDRVMEKYKGKIYRVWRHFPLPSHATAQRTHEASECASQQGKFWEFRNEFYKNPRKNVDNKFLMNLASQIGLDTRRFQSCVESGQFSNRVKDDVEKGIELGIRGTPTVFVNGKMVAGAVPYDEFDRYVQTQLRRSKS